MRREILRIAYSMLITLLLVVPALAQDHGPDTIGLWFDESATVNVIEDPQPLQQFSAYLVIHAPTHGEIAGLECAIDVPDGVFCTNIHFPPNFGNFGTYDNLIVVWTPPLNPDPDLVVLQLDYIVVSVPELPAFFVLGPSDPTSFPETNSPGYGGFEGDEVYLQALGYVFDDPAAARFEPGVVAVKRTSLSAVKSLFD